MHRDDLLLFGEGMSSEGVRYEAFNVHEHGISFFEHALNLSPYTFMDSHCSLLLDLNFSLIANATKQSYSYPFCQTRVSMFSTCIEDSFQHWNSGIKGHIVDKFFELIHVSMLAIELDHAFVHPKIMEFHKTTSREATCSKTLRAYSSSRHLQYISTKAPIAPNNYIPGNIIPILDFIEHATCIIHKPTLSVDINKRALKNYIANKATFNNMPMNLPRKVKSQNRTTRSKDTS
uniref:Uncharacterized protein n=1 Tax=Cucumis melo TaxID=3656 RepID=A0A9I9E845_CUCME